ncbi:Substrate binding domain of ABC-type glycine betaine transport system [Acididesulfobacillus acetoxydans]|uniref:Periplasmic glycine betaine/choline-binding (Lipo)protein of an ABC-type transport system (Osmoprotectant binding protein) n=1 Tax=Acididesulfobacillus acetoxydans TaxID=1561005 RepID=A0A8S0Y2B3_9FIRM|nr:glycine betaine ABC transporter substrate-binding protein [Acididesulfobacillus acetoxydans]CAA7600565.1 Substrate binding domain of ABC-type glycine betaine transport system [Acididesulfobacillus acetoxydans]CEJ06699.1 Periplasmic glycine betaine/choline-binding (Lipo)protein of an ABC-type transport system (Osmoprotectant binding protein) [Acididesulfobacillus acetoxydans]
MKRLPLLGLVTVLTLVLALGAIAGCGTGQNAASAGNSAAAGNAPKKGPIIKVSSKTFTEAELLGQMTYDYLKYLGYPVENKIDLGEIAVIRPALTSGQIDLYWEYTGTGVETLMHHAPVYNSQESYDLIKNWDAKNGIDWLDYAPLNDTYGIVVRPDIARKYNLKTISDYVNLVKKGVHLKFVGFPEWDGRADGLPAFEKAYNFTMPKQDLVNVAMGLGYDTLKAKKGDLMIANTTDAGIVADKFDLLQDNLHAFPVYNPCPVVREQIVKAYPTLPGDLKKLSSLLDTPTITGLNKQVDVDKKSIETVSSDFLKSKGLIK